MKHLWIPSAFTAGYAVLAIAGGLVWTATSSAILWFAYGALAVSKGELRKCDVALAGLCSPIAALVLATGMVR